MDNKDAEEFITLMMSVCYAEAYYNGFRRGKTIEEGLLMTTEDELAAKKLEKADALNEACKFWELDNIKTPQMSKKQYMDNIRWLKRITEELTRGGIP